jgi:hypothetical protein
MYDIKIKPQNLKKNAFGITISMSLLKKSLAPLKLSDMPIFGHIFMKPISNKALFNHIQFTETVDIDQIIDFYALSGKAIQSMLTQDFDLSLSNNRF